MILYYSPGACSQAPHIILHETGLNHDAKRVDLKSHTLEDGSSYYDINPKGAVPALELDSGEVLTENAVILQYLGDRASFPEVLPPLGQFRRYRVLELVNFITTELHKRFGFLFNPNATDEFKQFVTTDLKKKLDYIDGRLARHVPPFRTFLVALLLFIFAAEHATHEMTLGDAQRKAAHAKVMATPQGRAAEVTRRRAEAVKSLDEDLKGAAKDRDDSLKDPDEKPERVAATYAKAAARAQAHYARAQARADRIAKGESDDNSIEIDTGGAKRPDSWWGKGIKKAVANPDYYWSVLFTWGHRAAILLLPIVGLSLALVYRSRKQVFIYDHLLVAMNLLSFTFLTNAAGLVLPVAAMPYWFGLVAIWTPVNLFQTLRGAYGSSILGAIVKTLIVWWITVFWSLVLLTCLLVLAVAEL